jgi:hypothetical protein
MKVIQSKQIWDNGATSTAIYFNMWSFYDNLSTFVDFRYNLLDADKNVIYSNQIKMSGADYYGWTDNDYAYDWAANLLGLVIVSNYSTTTTTTTTTTTQP